MSFVNDAHGFTFSAQNVNNVGGDMHTHHHIHSHFEEPQVVLRVDSSDGEPERRVYQPPFFPCFCDPSLSRSQRYALLLFKEKQGYPLWSPQPNMALPDEYVQEGIRIGDVGIVHHDTPFDFLFSITHPADHPINHRGVPEGFTHIPWTELDITQVLHYRELDSNITGPEHTISSERTRDSDLAAGIDRSYDFTSSNHEGAILMLPEGSSLYKLENKTRFRKYAKDNAKAWFTYATQQRGREFPSDTNPSLYLVTGCEKCPSWGIASFFNPFPNRRIVSLPFNVLKGESSHYDVYNWGRDGRCDSRSHPNPRTSFTSDAPLTNQTVFIQGFKISKKRKATNVKVRDITGNKTKAERILDIKPLSLSTTGGFGNSQASSSRTYSGYNSQSSGSYSRALLPHDYYQCDDDTLDIDDSTVQERKAFHPCDLINHLMCEVASNLDPLFAISHDEDWMTLFEDGMPFPASFNGSDLLERISRNLIIFFDEDSVYTEYLPKVKMKPGSVDGDDSTSIGESNHEVVVRLHIVNHEPQSRNREEKMEPSPLDQKLIKSEADDKMALSNHFGFLPFPDAQASTLTTFGVDWAYSYQDSIKQSFAPKASIERPEQFDSFRHTAATAYHVTEKSPHASSWSQIFQELGEDIHTTPPTSTNTGPVSSDQVQGTFSQEQCYDRLAITPALQWSNAHSSPPATPENSETSGSTPPDSGSLLFAHPQQPQRLYSHREQLEFFMAVLSLPFSVTPSPFVPQAMYKPHANSDRHRQVKEAELDPPIYFWASNPSECGISLTDALHSRVGRLENRDEPVFDGQGPSVSICLEWPGYRQWSRQIPTKDFKSPPGPITKAKLAKNVAKCVQRFIAERQNQPLEDDADQRWRVGGPGSSCIKLEDLVLVSMHNVSTGSWQPHLRLHRQSHGFAYR